MQTTNNTVLITGGSAGIGFAMAKMFSEKGNTVIITGRNKEKLDAAAAQLANTNAIQCDVTNEHEVQLLIETIKNKFPQLNVLINNAGSVYAYKLGAGANSAQKAADEINTNYVSVIRLTENLLPVLQNNNSAIVTVSSIVAFAPGASVPTYSASKAALHAYTRVLRHTLALSNNNIKVFELMPPLVNTEFSKEIGGHNGIAPAEVAQSLINAFETDTYEIRVGNTEQLYRLSLASPENALATMNGTLPSNN